MTIVLGGALRLVAVILAIIGIFYLLTAMSYEKENSQIAYRNQLKSTICFILEALFLWVTLFLEK